MAAHRFKKGEKRHGGRKKGTPNKTTAFTRAFIQEFLDRNAEKVQRLFDKVARKDPHGALRLMVELCEFALPKLARVETSVTFRKDLSQYSDEDLKLIAEQDQRSVIDVKLELPPAGPQHPVETRAAPAREHRGKDRARVARRRPR